MPEQELWYHYSRALAFRRLGESERIIQETPPEFIDEIMRMISGEDAVVGTLVANEVSREISSQRELIVPSDENWIKYLRLLKEKKNQNRLTDGSGWTERAIQTLDKTTEDILRHFHDPYALNPEPKYGLVIGRVQSGKTANYTGLIAKAVDAGFDTIIVLAGLHDGLRNQTQDRLENELIGVLDPITGKQVPLSQHLGWSKFTKLGHDFGHQNNWVDPHILGGREHVSDPCNPAIFVVKKNHSVLKKLRDWFSDIPSFVQSRNLLVIDDEADHATVNTASALPEDLDEDEEESPDLSVTNEYLRQILQQFPRRTYVGYTATPFANVLIDSDENHPEFGPSLYPRDFIYCLPRPGGYIGLEDYFPEHGDEIGLEGQVTILPTEEITELLIDEERNQIPQSLESAIRQFVISGSLRMMNLDGEPFHHSMMIHIHHETRFQNPLSDFLHSKLIRRWKDFLLSTDHRLHLETKNQFREDFDKFDSVSQTGHDFEQLFPFIRKFMNVGIDVELVNSTDEGSALTFPKNENKFVIAIGGNSLSRGLTIEGLCVSYFSRTSKTYDTLLQMGRWFGFRPNYQSLTRIFITERALTFFRWLTRVEREIREEAVRFENESLDPREFGIKILTHPEMKVTAANKSRHGRIIRTNWANSIAQTFYLPLDDYNQLNLNNQTVSTVLQNMGTPLEIRGHLVWKNIQMWAIEHILREYKTPDGLRNTWNQLQILQHIRDNPDITWNLVLINGPRNKNTSHLSEYGYQGTFGLVKRTRIIGTTHIGALADRNYWAIDLPGYPERFAGTDGLDYGIMRDDRSTVPKQGLIKLYFIDSASEPTPNQLGTRTNIVDFPNEINAICGVAIAIPGPSEGPSDYMIGDGMTAL